jgi:hypothetical protein
MRCFSHTLEDIMKNGHNWQKREGREYCGKTNSQTYILMTFRSQIYQTGRSVELLIKLCNTLSFSS